MEVQDSDDSDEIELASKHERTSEKNTVVAQMHFGSEVRQLGANLTNVRLNSAEISAKSSGLKAAQQRHKNGQTNIITTVNNENDW